MTTTTPNFSELLETAVNEPGQISAAYFAFHGYSLGNRLLAMLQCGARDLQPGPLSTFMGWKHHGRSVKKGAKAITLCMPITCKRKAKDDAPDADEPEHFTRFVYKPHWFVLSQTEGDDFTAPELPEWQKSRALTALNITETPFDSLDGNTQGYARDRSVAVSPVAAHPLKTLFHELAHVLLGHTAEHALSDDERTPRSLREVEAEAVAMLCCAALNLPGVEFSRGYIQHWNRDGQPIPERSCARIFKTADQILKAGHDSEEAAA